MEANLAVLIDFENIAAGTEKEGLGRFDVDALMARIKDKGRILIARSYADWGRFARFKQTLLAANVTMMELTSHGMQDKNRADIALVVDTLELAFTKSFVDTFVVVSGDSDFTPLILKLRELNKRVIGCGTRSSTSRLLIQACDEFFFYDSIVQKAPQRPVGRSNSYSSSPDRRDRPQAPMARTNQNHDPAYELLVDVVNGLQRENPDPPLASVVKNAVLRKSPDFNEEELGFNSFARFLESAAEKEWIKLFRDKKSGGYRVDSIEAPTDVAIGDEESDTDQGTKVDWADPYVPAGVEEWVNLIQAEGLSILSAPTRKTILEGIVESVNDRKKRRRRINVQFVLEDLKKKLGRTHPELPIAAVKGLFHGLLRTGQLLHKDGKPIRTVSAPFTINKTAEEMNDTLVQLILDLLRSRGADLSNTALLAELLHGNAERTKDIEETLAWLSQRPPPEEGEEDGPKGPDLNDLDLEDLLSVDAPKSRDDRGRDDRGRDDRGRDDRGRDDRGPRREGRGDRERRPPRESREAQPSELDDPDALLVEDSGPPAESAEKPKRKRTRRKKDEGGEGGNEGGGGSTGGGGDDLDDLLVADD